MTTRTLAATAAALPQDSLDRRTMLASAGAAAVLAAIGAPAMAEVDPDAALLALREPYERTLEAMEIVGRPHSRAEEAYFTLRQSEVALDDKTMRRRSGLVTAERAYKRATSANLKVIDRISATPARTLKGAVFKAQISRRESDMDIDLLISIVSDLLAMGTAT